MRSRDASRRVLLQVSGAVLMMLLATEIAVAQDSPHERLAMRCTDCHTKDSWSPLDPTVSGVIGVTTNPPSR